MSGGYWLLWAVLTVVNLTALWFHAKWSQRTLARLAEMRREIEESA